MVIGIFSSDAHNLSSGKQVFTGYYNDTGFTSQSYVCSIGLLLGMFSFSGYGTTQRRIPHVCPWPWLVPSVVYIHSTFTLTRARLLLAHSQSHPLNRLAYTYFFSILTFSLTHSDSLSRSLILTHSQRRVLIWPKRHTEVAQQPRTESSILASLPVLLACCMYWPCYTAQKMWQAF